MPRRTALRRISFFVSRSGAMFMAESVSSSRRSKPGTSNSATCDSTFASRRPFSLSRTALRMTAVSTRPLHHRVGFAVFHERDRNAAGRGVVRLVDDAVRREIERVLGGDAADLLLAARPEWPPRSPDGAPCQRQGARGRPARRQRQGALCPAHRPPRGAIRWIRS